MQFFIFLFFINVRLLSVLPTSKDFYIRSYPLHYFLILIPVNAMTYVQTTK